MANVGSGYGGGGAGGGEKSSNSFTGSSAGKQGYAAHIWINKIVCYLDKNILVNYAGTNYPIYNLDSTSAVAFGSTNMGKTTTTKSKMTLRVPLLVSTRSYTLSPLKIKDDDSGAFGELYSPNASSVLNSGFYVVYSKIRPVDGDNLQLLINFNKTSISSDLYEGSYPGQILSEELTNTSSNISGTMYAGSTHYFLLQGAGGGGGGADNSWGLFNYASGGGGGGAGGAVLVKFTTNIDRMYRIFIGSGGSAGTSHKDEGSRTSGGSGGSTYVQIYSDTSSSSVAYTIYAYGGGGGGKSTGNSDHGSAGSGGGVSVPSGVTNIFQVTGGNGGRNGAGKSGSSSGSSTDSTSYDICNATLSIDVSIGSGGSVGSLDDAGGGGGGSWLGNGGYY